MSFRDPLLYVDDILEAIQRIEEYTANIDEKKFLKDVQLQDAVIHRLAVIGEAAKKIPNEWKKKYADLPWKAIMGTRDKLIHDYFGIDKDEIWGIVQKDLASLRDVMKHILSKEEGKK